MCGYARQDAYLRCRWHDISGYAYRGAYPHIRVLKMDSYVHNLQRDNSGYAQRQAYPRISQPDNSGYAHRRAYPPLSDTEMRSGQTTHKMLQRYSDMSESFSIGGYSRE